MDEPERCPVCDRPSAAVRDHERFAVERPGFVPEPGAGQLGQWQGPREWYDHICWTTAGPLCCLLAVD